MTANTTCAKPDAILDATISMVLFSIFCMIGVSSNILILYIIFTRKQMQTPSNYCVISLAIADLGSLVFAVPSYSILKYSISIPDLSFCRLYMIFLKTLIYSSTYTHVAIAFERHRVIVFPMKPRLSSQKMKIVNASIWIIVFVCVAPIYGFLTTIIPYCGKKSYCGINLEAHSDFLKMVFYGFVFSFNWIIPYGIVIFLYRQTCCCLKQHVVPTEKNQDPMVALRSKQNSKIIRMLIILVLSSAITNLPSFMYIVLETVRICFNIHLFMNKDVFSEISHANLFAGFCCNPFVLYFMSNQYHQAINCVFTSFATKMGFKSKSFTIEQKEKNYSSAASTYIWATVQSSHKVLLIRMLWDMFTRQLKSRLGCCL